MSTFVRRPAGYWVREVDGVPQTTPAGTAMRYTRPYSLRASCTHSLSTAGRPCPWCGAPQ